MALTLNVSRDDFLSALASLQSVTGKKGTIAILSNVLIETENDSMILTGTDLEIGIKKAIPAEIISPGTITLPCRKLFEIVRESMAEQIHLELLDNNWVKITADLTDYNLAGMPAEEFPTFPEYNKENLVSLPCEVIKELIDKTIYSVAQEGESQFNLSGVLVEREIKDGTNSIRLVSSDGHRLSLMESQVDIDLSNLNMDRNIIIPRKGIQEIRKFCEGEESIDIGFEEKQAVVKTGDSLMIIRLMNGEFPDYHNIIQVINKAKYIEIDRISLINSMKRMNIFTEDRFNAVQFNIKDNKIILSSQSMDIGSAKDELSIDYNDVPLQLGFNGRYFIDALQVMNSEKVKAYINSEESPCMIQGEDDPGYLSIIMPMKL